MNTLKSAALIIVLGCVLYGVYVALSKPEFAPGTADMAESATDLTAPLVEFGPATSGGPGSGLPPPPLTHSPGSENPAAPFTSGAARTGTYQPPGSASAAPASAIPASIPALEPTASGGGELKRSTYEAPISVPSDPTSRLLGANNTPAGVATGAAATENKAATADVLTPAESSPSAVGAVSLQRDWQEAAELVEAGKFRSALAKLSPHFTAADLLPDQRPQLAAWLDALAAKVIYSPDHLLAEPHKVRKGEVLFDIAKQHNVSWMLLQSINHRLVSDPMVLVPGTELKIVPGPFRADVNLMTSELTLFVGDLYAGRFPFSLGDQPPRPGPYKVLDKQQEQRSYYGLDGRVIPANDPSNPYGGWWISLGGEVCIHGSPLSPASQTLGCISLSPQDAKDAYSILSIGSEVTIRR